VDQDAWIERLDAHMERGNKIMARSDKIMARSDLTMRRSNEIMARNDVAFREWREFLADQTLVMQGLARVVDQIARRTDRLTAKMDADHKEFIEGIRAQRQALFKVFDRLDRNGGGTGAPGAA
jgi:hypothetical protein